MGGRAARGDGPCTRARAVGPGSWSSARRGVWDVPTCPCIVVRHEAMPARLRLSRISGVARLHEATKARVKGCAPERPCNQPLGPIRSDLGVGGCSIAARSCLAARLLHARRHVAAGRTTSRLCTSPGVANRARRALACRPHGPFSGLTHVSLKTRAHAYMLCSSTRCAVFQYMLLHVSHAGSPLISN